MPELEAVCVLECDVSNWKKHAELFDEKVMVDLTYEPTRCTINEPLQKVQKFKNSNSNVYSLKGVMNLGG